MPHPLFHVKVCGVTSADDARLVAAAGADAVGFNFIAGSPRHVAAEVAREAVATLPDGVLAVGVFAAATSREMLAVAGLVGLDAIQLHGHLSDDDSAHDPPKRCRELAGLPVIRAVRMDGDGLAAARRWLAAATAAGRSPQMLIVDAAVSGTVPTGQLGGTGHVVDWAALRREPAFEFPIALAGGLTADNVAAAIRATGLRAVDTASGVELSPGRKDPDRVRAFVAAAREALGLPVNRPVRSG
ncbi:MAG: phosphoribosylanthranilate isomerase [Planctomycetes bacterium]|nr:phosphoribosylanthranilate isomerase [Planctomycetota bacterium]